MNDWEFYTGKNPTNGCLKVRAKKREHVLSTEQYLRCTPTLETIYLQIPPTKFAVSQKRQALVLLLIAHTGRRPDEIVRLRWQDIDFTSSTALLTQHKGQRRADERAKHQTIALSPYALQLLHLAKKLKAPDDPANSAYVFCCNNRLGHIERTITVWKKVRKAVGIANNVDAYTLKHMFITISATVGQNLVAIQHQVGHSDPSTTESYARTRDLEKIGVVTAISAHIDSKNEPRDPHSPFLVTP